jgi:protoheme IX farnesyltransferase
VTAAATWLLLIAGSLVTSTGSGLAVPDWPLSYGMWFPPMVGGILYEHGHRMLAAVVGALILGLAVWLGRVDSRRWVRGLGWAALGAVVCQALLGGLTVVWLLPPAVSIAHAVLGQAVFCLVVCLAVAIRSQGPGAREQPTRPSSSVVFVALLAAAQVVLGAVIRHTGYAVGAHLAVGVILAFLSGGLLWRVWTQRTVVPMMFRGAVRLAGLLVVQLGLGGAVFVHRGALLLRTAHVAVGSLVLAQAVLLVWETSRSARRGATGWGQMPRTPNPEPRAPGHRWKAYVELTKPRVSGLVLMTTAVGFWLGMRSGDAWARFWPALLGTALVVAGANALNQWMERVEDGLMQRTRHRPLPSGRLTPEEARRFGLGLVVIGTVWLTLSVHLLSAILAAVAAATYLLLYTPMKRASSLCTLVGAVSGALPPVIGWAAARGTVTLEAWVLFGLLFVWQLPHFLSIAMLYQEDYARGGFRMLPLLEAGNDAAVRHTLLGGLILLPVSLLPATIGMSGTAYFFSAIFLGLALLWPALRMAASPTRSRCRELFVASVLYLPALLGILVMDRV